MRTNLESMWKQRHKLGAKMVYSLCSKIGDLFVKFGDQCAWVCPVLFSLSSSLIFKLHPTLPTQKSVCDRSCSLIVLVTVIALMVLCVIMFFMTKMNAAYAICSHVYLIKALWLRIHFYVPSQRTGIILVCFIYVSKFIIIHLNINIKQIAKTTTILIRIEYYLY
jgi:hypothetical protein